ncbi:hypothetical protein MCOR21_003398 [Pyricularia oryzae]|uniref:TauD/TfdA-like domain-containing protein n=1 Tax=Pyricularia grisea TaxID=148305 RepID=A0ABQ8NUJ5_PYRGI|nr:hypothetical protein MCOR19_009271 [Pyricularia oryzae]KAI6302341.1 hypothetical protein MCOR33_002370 [Pyricularia grisea]KAI6349844.1 hypothetical protein MCOR28_000625 [Pyricularia oryzae]KAI6432517.1 hypothetical protein MCOR21_003398 [Pyricularia oryzae]KAI6546151.1 hypothetical protein MCOR05_000874 [Pyricularia oryzae]
MQASTCQKATRTNRRPPIYLQDLYKARSEEREHVEPTLRADKGTSWRCWWRSGASFVSATCDQDLSLQQQLNLGKHFGEVEVHPQVPYVPGLPGVHIIWPNLQAMQSPALFRRPGGASRWHSDLVH